MYETLNTLEKSVKTFLSDKINRLTVIAVICFGVLGYSQIKMFKEFNSISKQVTKAERKVDFRYFNLTRSLQDINHVEIETRAGRVVAKQEF